MSLHVCSLAPTSYPGYGICTHWGELGEKGAGLHLPLHSHCPRIGTVAVPSQAGSKWVRRLCAWCLPSPQVGLFFSLFFRAKDLLTHFSILDYRDGWVTSLNSFQIISVVTYCWLSSCFMVKQKSLSGFKYYIRDLIKILWSLTQVQNKT